MTWGLCTALALTAALAAGSAMPALAAPGPPSLTASAMVDFARPVATHSLVGFLHGLDDSQPGDRMIVPLQPTLWRGSLDSAPYARAIAFGAQYMLVVSDLWGYPGAGWYGRCAPWDDWDAWSAFVRNLARSNRGRDIVWDIWNEPDVPYFWTGSQDQYHELYRRAYLAIRQEFGPEAMLAGPSVASFRWDWLTGLLEFCRTNDCRVAALSWHELPGGRGVTSISQHLRRARAGVLRNPAYATVGVRELCVGEYTGAGDAAWPGEAVGYLSQLERGGADKAARACWPEYGEDTCTAHTLDGLLDRATSRPRAPWWALRWYARGVGSRVRSRSSDPALAVMAARAPDARHAEIVVGYFDTHDRALLQRVDVVLDLRGLDELPFLPGDVRPHVTGHRVGARGQAPTVPIPMPAPEGLGGAHGRATVRLRGLQMHDAMLVRLSAPRSRT